MMLFKIKFGVASSDARRKSKYISLFSVLGALFSISLSTAICAQELDISVESSLCEGNWVLIQADHDLENCTISSVDWYIVRTDGSEELIDGSQSSYKLDGFLLRTRKEGAVKGVASCAEGSQLEGTGTVIQQTDFSKC